MVFDAGTISREKAIIFTVSCIQEIQRAGLFQVTHRLEGARTPVTPAGRLLVTVFQLRHPFQRRFPVLISQCGNGIHMTVVVLINGQMQEFDPGMGLFGIVA